MKERIVYLLVVFLIVSCSNSKKEKIVSKPKSIETSKVEETSEKLKAIDSVKVVKTESLVQETKQDVPKEKQATIEKKETIIANEVPKEKPVDKKLKVEESIANKTDDVNAIKKEPIASQEVIKEKPIEETVQVVEKKQKPIDEKARTFIKKEAKISGNWSFKQLGSQVFLVFHSNFKTKKGPDLKVFLSKQDISAVTAKNATQHAILLKNLISNSGEQRYLIPSNVDLTAYKCILIHCVKYTKLWGGGKL